jgi:hypothetical protein
MVIENLTSPLPFPLRRQYNQPVTHRKRDKLLTGTGGEEGEGRSQIIRRRESLALDNTVNILCNKSNI